MLSNLVAVLVFYGTLITARKLDTLSFEPPFDDFDGSGLRMAGKLWRSSGTTVVNSNFIRLVPDRQSKKGALWSRKPLAVPAFSAILKFRISGQGKNFFGDGIAFWIVQQGYHVDGDVHGSAEKFTGIGIVFDTFKNTETINAHRDVLVLINDGEKTYEMMTEDVKGCNNNFRYHNDRADFSVTDSSRCKVVLEKNKLSVFMDSQNSGDWTECVTVENTQLPEGWLSKAHIGFTATTGQLADNHDILSFQAFSDFTVMEASEEADAAKKLFPTQESTSATERLKRLEEAINTILEKLEVTEHHVEHQFAAVDDHIDNMLAKLAKREDASESRIENLESVIRKQVQGELEGRLQNLESKLTNNINRKAKTLENDITKSIEETIDSKAINTNSGGWKLPFFLLVMFIVGCAIGLYLFYLKLKKTHML